MANLMRKFKFSDADMLQDADTMLSIYGKEEAAFVQFNNIIFSPAFKTDFQQLISEARDSLRDELIIDEQAEKTTKVEEVMEKCRQYFRLVRFLVERAFPGDKNIYNQFGFNDFENARRSHNGMRIFLDMIKNPVEKYNTSLIAIGAPGNLVQQLNQLLQELHAAKTEQEDFKKYRPAATDRRIELMNLVWDKMIDIYDSAQLIFYNNPTKLQLFALRSVTKFKENEPVEEEPVEEGKE